MFLYRRIKNCGNQDKIIDKIMHLYYKYKDMYICLKGRKTNRHGGCDKKVSSLLPM